MEKIKKEIKEKLLILPDKPGVYLMKNINKKIIYVGKAKNLKNRIRSYFSGNHHDNKTNQLVGKINDLEYIITDTEEEALILESNLIKKYLPKYNIMLKDDKDYPYIKLTVNEDFPKIFYVRKLQKDGAKYFGPYTNIKAVRKTISLMEWIFPLRTCKLKLKEGENLNHNPCMNFQLGKCPAPCSGQISKKEYSKLVKNIFSFLKGHDKEVIDDLKQEMMACSDDMKYEKAAKIRDKIQQIEKITQRQSTFFSDQKDRDVVGLYTEGTRAAVTVLKIINGKLMNRETYGIQNVEDKQPQEIVGAFIKQYYSEKLDSLPYKIMLQIEPTDFNFINNWLSNIIIIPQRGENRRLLMIAKENAFNFIEEEKLKYLRKSTRTILPVQELKEKLNLKRLPRKMVCFDISTIQGVDTVSSMVFFENGKPKKKNYRHFIIQTVEGQDDFASMAESLTRYLSKIDDEIKADLIVIDGGKGQLSSAYSILKNSKIPNIEMISLAKRIEEVFKPNSIDSIILPKSSSALRLLIHIRDESHRFAITFHRKRRSNRILSSELDRIKGIGKEKKFLMLKQFGSVENIKKATIIDLAKVKGIGLKTAESIQKKLLENCEKK